ncbi:MAG: DinB family protein [Candidatus Promineifilaceae bacterium]
MKIDEIRLLYKFNDWADDHILAACTRVSAEQYAAPTSCGTGHGGLRATMVHLLDSTWQVRIALQGYYEKPLANEAAYDATELHEDAFPTLAALQERWVTEQREMWAYIDTLTEEMLNGMIRYVIPGAVRKHVVWHLLLDVINHATQHRSEAAMLLTGYGQSPGDFDFGMFLNERAQENS